jgi:glycosyltransferase involved in cell wall biosynthesis
MEFTMAKISVVMTVYNGEKFLEEAIRSILEQTFGEFEFIIVDDGSTDRSVELIRKHTDGRIRFFPLAHVGRAAALN